ncbi:hypothetical protein [Dyella silvae]|uniref:hypothetical protein n=1 Tax=Dyella silvae TaxID=2994424 RepID=UPI002263FDEC|nr:hypothetical protein [Dyella silvae]
MQAEEGKQSLAGTLNVDPPDRYAATWSMFPHLDRHWMLDTDPTTANGTCSEIASKAVRFANQMKAGKTADDLYQPPTGSQPGAPKDPLEKLNEQNGRINESVINNVWSNFKKGKLRDLSDEQIFNAYDLWCKATYSRVTS